MTAQRARSNQFPSNIFFACARQIGGDSYEEESPTIRLQALRLLRVDRIDSIFFAYFSKDSVEWSGEEFATQRERERQENTFLRAKFMGFYSVIIVRRRRRGRESTIIKRNKKIMHACNYDAFRCFIFGRASSSRSLAKASRNLDQERSREIK